MIKKNISELNNLQLGRYGEYLIKMEYTLYGFDVYSSEIDEKAIDFIVSKDGKYYDIQVKTLRKSSYVYLQKHVSILRDNFFVALVLINSKNQYSFYLIPSTVWKNPEGCFVSHDYEKEGLTSKPEWGINISRKNLGRLEQYRFDKTLSLMFIKKDEDVLIKN